MDSKMMNEKMIERFTDFLKTQTGAVEIAFASKGGSAFNRSSIYPILSLEIMKTILTKNSNVNIAYLGGIDPNHAEEKMKTRKNSKIKKVKKSFLVLDADLKDCFKVDLRKDLKTSEERVKCFKDFLAKHPEFEKYVSFSLLSGNGCHFYIELEEVFSENEIKWKFFYKQIQMYVEKLCNNEIKFDPATSNINRLMRLPFSTNWKDATTPIKTTGITFNETPLKIKIAHFPSLQPSEKSLDKTDSLLDSPHSRQANFIEFIWVLKKSIGHRNQSTYLLTMHLLAQSMPTIELHLKLFYELLDQTENDSFKWIEIRTILENCIVNKITNPPVSPLVESQWHGNDGEEKLIRHDLSWKLLANIFIKWISNGGKSKLISINEQFYLYSDGIYEEISDKKVEQKINDFVHTYHSILFIKTNVRARHEILSSIKLELNIETQLLPPYAMKKNGLVEINAIPLKNGFILTKEIEQFPAIKLFPYSQETVFFNRLEFEFMPLKKSENLNQLLSISLPESSLQNIVQEFFGLALTRNIDFEKFLLLYGDGANGKGVLLFIFSLLLGKGNYSSISIDALDPKRTYNRGELYGKVANLIFDLNKFNGAAEGEFKNIISGEPILADRKFKNFIIFSPYAKWIIASNHLPNFADDSDGITRRMLIIPFRHQIPPEKRNLNLKQKDYWLLNNEISGVFNWAMLGLQRLLKNGQFTESSFSLAALEEFKNTQNSIRDFALDTFEEFAGTSISTHEAYSLYREHALSQGLNPIPKPYFTKKLKLIFKNMRQEKNPSDVFFQNKKIRDRRLVGIRKQTHTTH